MSYQTQCECNLLEPDDVKMSSPVLRGLGGSNVPRLPGIEIGTRRVYISGITAQPTQRWVAQQARQLMWDLDAEERRFTHVLRDNDGKYGAVFDAIFESEGIEVVRTPLRAPRANAYAERWVRSVREECLDRVILLDQRHLV